MQTPPTYDEMKDEYEQYLKLLEREKEEKIAELNEWIVSLGLKYSDLPSSDFEENYSEMKLQKKFDAEKIFETMLQERKEREEKEKKNLGDTLTFCSKYKKSNYNFKGKVQGLPKKKIVYSDTILKKKTDKKKKVVQKILYICTDVCPDIINKIVSLVEL